MISRIAQTLNPEGNLCLKSNLSPHLSNFSRGSSLPLHFDRGNKTPRHSNRSAPFLPFRRDPQPVSVSANDLANYSLHRIFKSEQGTYTLEPLVRKVNNRSSTFQLHYLTSSSKCFATMLSPLYPSPSGFTTNSSISPCAMYHVP